MFQSSKQKHTADWIVNSIVPNSNWVLRGPVASDYPYGKAYSFRIFMLMICFLGYYCKDYRSTIKAVHTMSSRRYENGLRPFFPADLTPALHHQIWISLRQTFLLFFCPQR